MLETLVVLFPLLGAVLAGILAFVNTNDKEKKQKIEKCCFFNNFYGYRITAIDKKLLKLRMFVMYDPEFEDDGSELINGFCTYSE